MSIIQCAEEKIFTEQTT